MQDESYWIRRNVNDPHKDWGDTQKNWIEDYWDSRFHPHRYLLLQTLKKFVPFVSVLELGCNCGPNLWMIHENFPEAELTGIDVNDDALSYGRRKLPFVLFMKGDITGEFPRFEKGMHDIIISDATLMYVNEEKIAYALTRVTSLEPKAIILFEWYDADALEGCHSRERDYHWLHDYPYFFDKLGYKVAIQKIPRELWPSENWQRNGRCIVAFPRLSPISEKEF